MTGTNSKNEFTPTKNIQEWIKITILIAATALGAYEFIWKDNIWRNRPTALEIDALLKNEGEKGDLILIRAQITSHNPTDRRIYVPAFWATVTGYRLSDSAKRTPLAYQFTPSESSLKAQTDPSGNQWAHFLKPEDLGEPQETIHYEDRLPYSDRQLVRTFAPITREEIVAQRRIIYKGESWWEPMDKTHNEFVFAIPKDEFDYLKMYVHYLQTRDKRGMEPPSWGLLKNNNAWFAFPDSTVFCKTELNKKKNLVGHNWYITALPLWNRLAE